MGIISGIGKVILSPVYIPYKIRKNKIEKQRAKKLNDRSVVEAIVKTSYPENYRDFYESEGYKTDIIKGRVVVWAKGLSDKEIQEIKEKHLKGIV